MKILVISDLHTGTGAIATDFSTGESSNAVKEGYMQELKSLAEKEKLSADYLIIPGDISNHSEYSEFDLASKRLTELSAYFGISERNIFFVPGNHDGNWDDEKASKEKSEPVELSIKKKYSNIQNNSFFDSIIRNAVKGCFYSKPYYVHWQDENLNVLGINSAAYDSYDKPLHHGSLDKHDLRLLSEYMDELIIQYPNRVNILVLHHHPIQHPDLPFSDPDHSILHNAALLMELATKNCFNFIIHGHKHIPRLELHMDSYQHPVNVICSGSFSARLDERWFQGTPNCIHLIEIDSMCPQNNTPRGILTTWYHYSGHGWISNNPVNGIPHKEFFGNHMARSFLSSTVKEIIEQYFAKRSHITWDDLINENQDLKYTSRKLLSVILKELSQEIGFDIFSKEDNEQSFVIIKR